jgi:hypothetical protein
VADQSAVGGGENHQCGENDLGITRDDNYQQVEKHTMKHNNVAMIENSDGKIFPNPSLVFLM